MNEQIIKDKIGAIEFRLLSPKLIKKMAAVKVLTPELYDADGYPMDGGLMDLRMGVIDPGLRCRTCGSKVRDCPGHFGYIELARPVIHVEFVDYIYNFLRATCRKCGRILLSEKEIEKFKEKLEMASKEESLVRSDVLNEILKRAKATSVCPHCGEKQGKIKLKRPTTFIEDGVNLTPIDVRERLERIPDDDLPLLGMSPQAGRPEWMVLTLLPIPPVTVRPSITLETGERSEDDLTHKLGDIVRTNQRLAENIMAGAPQIIIDDLWELLQYHVTTFFNNSISQVPPARHRSGRVLKTLADRIRGKEGRFRHNLAGKRVDFSARTVISPDSYIKPDEVGVPYEVAMELTIPERVTEWNIEWLKKFVENGPDKYPGANYVITPQGRKRITKETKEAILQELVPGHIVERHLLDGDLVLFNRQPSLHRMNIMAHRVRVLPYKTFRISPVVTDPYNADFDGDEMNLHVPQTEEARAEAEILMEVKHHLVTPRYGLPIVGGKQDYVLGCYLLTSGKRKFPRSFVEQLMFSIGVEEIPDKKEFTGKEIFSLLLPKDFNYVEDPEKCKECKQKGSDTCVLIKNGQLICGAVTKKLIGGGKGKLFQEFYKLYGPEKTLDLMHKVALLGVEFLMHEGASVSLADTDLPEGAHEKIVERLKKAEEEVEKLIKLYKEGKLEPYPGRTARETLEGAMMSILNQARDDTSKVLKKYLKRDTGTFTMIRSGAKGSTLNLILMVACLGQQSLRGERISRGYRGRTLSLFKKGDIGVRAGGFVMHGYKEGLDPVEFFFHAVAGRDSLVNKGMRTPKSGYLQRRLVNALQDVKVLYDGTVRDSSGVIIQFKYGEDGIDVSKSDHGDIDIDMIIERVKGVG